MHIHRAGICCGSLLLLMPLLLVLAIVVGNNTVRCFTSTSLLWPSPSLTLQPPTITRAGSPSVLLQVANTRQQGCVDSTAGSSNNNNDDNANGNLTPKTSKVSRMNSDASLLSRRDLSVSLAGAAAAAAAAASIFPVRPANAFANKISIKYDDRPKRRGPMPKDLGVSKRKDMIGDEYLGLKNCGPAPNCFCSTDDAEDDPEHSIPAWKWPASMMDSQEAAFRELEEVILAYQPGHSGGIDGGGFSIQAFDPIKGYLYVQFEALKNGYLDDVEFAVVDDNKNSKDRIVQIRSSSRIGYLDYGVNAKRINYIAKALRSKGWDAPGVDFETHKEYAVQNSIM